MEEKRGVSRRTAGIIRVILFVIIVILLAFFVIRFFKHRQEQRQAERQVAESSQSSPGDERENKDNTVNESDENNETNRGSANQEGGSSGDNGSGAGSTDLDSTDEEGQVPRGFSDGTGVDSGVDEVPNTGTGENIALTSIAIAALIYTALRYKYSRSEIASLS